MEISSAVLNGPEQHDPPLRPDLLLGQAELHDPQRSFLGLNTKKNTLTSVSYQWASRFHRLFVVIAWAEVHAEGHDLQSPKLCAGWTELR